jgi:glycine cleavage system H lipoate-binding protein
MVVLLVLLTLVLFVVADAVVLHLREREKRPAAEGKPVPAPLELPGGMFLHPTHTWITIEPGGMVKIGLDEIARKLIGPVNGLRFAENGWRVRKGETLLWLKVGGEELPVPSPVGGTVKETRAAHAMASGNDPDAWLVALEPDHLAADLRPMRLAEEATSWLLEEMRRLRLALEELHFATNGTLLDGGEPTTGILGELGKSQREQLFQLFLVRS